MKHIVAISGGKDSTALALRLAEKYPDQDFTYICTPTGDELPEMIAHWEYLEQLLGKPIERVTAKKDLNGLIEDFEALPNFRMRWCTRMLKIEPAIAYYKQFPGSTVYVGLRADEPDRKGGIYGDIVNQAYPFREWGWGLKEVWEYLNRRGVSIPRRTDCARCYHQRLPEWYVLNRDFPDLYQSAVDQEEKTGKTFRSAQRDSFPAALVDMREAFRSGRVPRNLSQYEEEKAPCRACSL